MGLVEDTSMGRLILRMLSTIAEFDRDMIVERLAEGKTIAKQNPDFREGRPKKFTKNQVAHALQLLETNSYTQVEVISGIFKSTLIRAKREVAKGEVNNGKEITFRLSKGFGDQKVNRMAVKRIFV
ncbi:recombinase family protein [Sporosarcina sp. ANT_H38]|nr:recombinase family protein [Sporosarcina sp. ANT_H38]